MERPRDPDGRLLCTCQDFFFGPTALVTGVEVDDQVYAWRHDRVDGVGRIDTPDGGLVGAWDGDTVHVYRAAGRTFSPDGPERMLGSDGRSYARATGEAADGQHLVRVDTRTTFAHRWEAFFPDTVFFTPPPAGPHDREAAEDAPVGLWVVPAGVVAAAALHARRRRA